MKKFLDLEEFFYLKNKKKTTQKLYSFINSGENKIYLLLDFDRTVTTGKDITGKDLTIWGALKALLPRAGQLEYDRFYEKYRNLEIKNRLLTKDTIKWWKSILNLYKEYQAGWLGIKKAANKMQIRPGAKELFKFCNKKNIPTIIISAGIKNVIELFCNKFKIKPTIILSTKLTFSDSGYVSGWERDSLTHVLNKKEKGQKEIKKIKATRPKTILLGDSLNDVLMAEGENNVLRIAIPDQMRDENIENLREFTKKFDLVIKDKTLYPVIKILNLF